MKPRQDPWPRLVAAARRAPEGSNLSAPYGFAARVAAQAMAAEPARATFLDYFSPQASLRALGVACLLAVATAGVGYPSLTKMFSYPALPAVSFSSGSSAAGTSVPDLEGAHPAPANLPATNASAPDDPVAELMDAVS